MVLRLASPSFDFVFLLLAQESPSKLGSPFARSSVPTLGRASELSLLSLIGNVLRLFWRFWWLEEWGWQLNTNQPHYQLSLRAESAIFAYATTRG